MENMEKLLSNLISSDDFKKLSFLKNKINIFDIVGFDRIDDLYRLLNPHESHKLGDAFFKELLKTIVQVDNKYLPLLYADMSDLEVTHYKSILFDNGQDDTIPIFMESRKSKTVCILVDTFFTRTTWYLKRYIRYVEKNYKDYNRLFIYYISDNGATNFKKRYKDYIRIDYGTLYNITDEILKARGVNPDSEMKSFLTDYKEIMKKCVMGGIDYDTIDVCYKIYSEHKDAIDNIIKYEKPRYFAGMLFKEILDESDRIEYTIYNDYYLDESFRFLCFPCGIDKTVREKQKGRRYPYEFEKPNGEKYYCGNYYCCIDFKLFYHEEPNVYFSLTCSCSLFDNNMVRRKNVFRKALENELNIKLPDKYKRFLYEEQPLFNLDIVNIGNKEEVKAAMKKRFDEKCAPFIEKFVAAMNKVGAM